MTLIGATTENPSFEVIRPLLSRAQVYVLKPLEEEQLQELLQRAITTDEILKKRDIKVESTTALFRFSGGDARKLLNILDLLDQSTPQSEPIVINDEVVTNRLQENPAAYDKSGEMHYDIISAFIKSIRGSDPDAAVYWLARMLEAGEDPLFIARRLIRFASEDVGLADSQALPLAVAAYQACHFNGMPECNLNLAQTVIYLSLAPRSNAVYRAYETAKADALNQLSEPVPLVIRNAPTQLMADLNYGEGYVYAHDTEEKIAHMACLPDSLKDRRYYLPETQGAEGIFKERLEKSRAFRLGEDEAPPQAD